MNISLIDGLSDGFKKCSSADRPYDSDDDDGGAPPIPIADPPVDDPAGIPEQRQDPWLVPGVGSSF